MELGPEDVSLLERYPHFRGCYASMTKSCLVMYRGQLRHSVHISDEMPKFVDLISGHSCHLGKC